MTSVLTPRRFLNALRNGLLLLLRRLWFLWTKSRDVPKREEEVSVGGVRDVPGPFALPYFGSLRPKFQDIQVEEYCSELYGKYGPLVKFEYLKNIPVFFVLEAEDCKRVLNASTAEIRPPMELMVSYRQTRPDLYDNTGLINQNGGEWERLQKVLAKITLNHSHIATCHEGFNQIASDLLVSFQVAGPQLDLLHYCNRIAVECSFYLFFDMRMGLLGGASPSLPQPNLVDFLKSYFSSFHKTMPEFPLFKYFAHSLQHTFVKAESEMLDLVEGLVQTTLSTGGGSLIFKKIFQLDLSYKTKRLSILEFLNGATDPVLNQLVFILYEISRDERVEAKVVKELMAAMPSKDTPIYDADVTKLPYLRACISETSRLSPTAPNVARVTDKAVQIQGYQLPPYSVVIAQTMFAAKSPELFYQPETFLPERWLGEAGGAPPFSPHRPDVLRPFGSNKRTCPGRRIFISLATIFVARILRAYKITFNEPLQSTFDFLRVVKGPTFVTLEERPQ